MKKSLSCLSLVALFTGLALSPAHADDPICGAAPSLPTTANTAESIKGQLQGQADFLLKLVGKAELAGQVEAARNSIYQTSDTFFAAQKEAYLAYMFCVVVMNDKTLSTQDKLDAINKFKRPIGAEKAKADAARKLQIDQLAGFINEASSIQEKFVATDDVNAIKASHFNWCNSVYDYLLQLFWPSYAEQFCSAHDTSGTALNNHSIEGDGDVPSRVEIGSAGVAGWRGYAAMALSSSLAPACLAWSAANAARSAGSCLWALSLRKPLAASHMAALVQRNAIEASCQCLTFRQTCRIVPFMFSMMFVQASDRRSSSGRPRRVTVRISSRPSRMLAETPGASRSKTAREIDDQPLRLVGVSKLPGLAQGLAHAGVQGFRQPLDDVARLVDLAALDRRMAAERGANRLRQRLRAVDDEQAIGLRIEPAPRQVVEQSLADGGVLRRPFHHRKRMLFSLAVDPDRRQQHKVFTDVDAVDLDDQQVELGQVRRHPIFHPLGRQRHEAARGRRFRHARALGRRNVTFRQPNRTGELARRDVDQHLRQSPLAQPVLAVGGLPTRQRQFAAWRPRTRGRSISILPP